MSKINLFGGSGHGKVIIEAIRQSGNEAGVVYDDAPHCEHLSGCRVMKASDNEIGHPLIISIGNNHIRKIIAERYPGDFATIAHPSAIISESAAIGEGSVVMAGAIIQTEVSIGRHCIINTGASIDHECHIGDFCHIAPHATLCGDVTLGEECWIGAGSTVIQGVKIGRGTMIGAGSVVVNDIPENVVAFGNPCRVHRKLD